jgi:hypothetical protein
MPPKKRVNIPKPPPRTKGEVGPSEPVEPTTPRVKNKFKDTKVGEFLKKASPGILETIGDFVPGGAILDVAAELIRGDDNMSEEEKDIAESMMLELYALEVQDRDSARNRQARLAEVGHEDLMFNVAGIVGLAAFIFIVIAIVFLEVPESNKEVWIHLIGICEGVVLSIFGYFYGSSRLKNKI